jgi:type IV pilus assembly protein PilM
MGDESIWKKEISFGRKRKEPEQADERSRDEPTSVWKKEISLGRKKKADAEPDAIAEEPTVDEPVADEEPAWTRAISFGRKAEPEPAAAVPEEGTWTRAVSFGRKAESEPEHVVEEPLAEEPAVEEATWTRAVSFGRKADAPVVEEPAVIADESSHVPGTVPEPGPEEAVAPAQAWSAQPAPPVQLEPIEREAPPPVSSAPLEPAPVVHAPVTADELPPVEDDEPEEKKVPFWKKEIGGKKKDKAPKAERAPKQPKQPKQPKEKKQKAPKQPKVRAARGSRGAKRITGLKVGASQLAAARVANNGSAELLQVARTPLEPGIVVGGELRDPDALAKALKDFFAKNNLPKKGVRLGIANNRIGVRTFDIAGIADEKQLGNAIRFRAQETLPIPIDEAVLDYQVLGDSTTEDGQPAKRVLLVVAYRELIDRYIDACKKAGISLMGIDLEAFALLRALQAPQGADVDSDAALVAVAIGHDRSTFAVSDGRTCEFTRVLEWGGSALNVAIARALDAAPSEVDGVKRALALTDEMVPEGLTPEQAQKARDAMRRAIQTFARELVSSLQYYQNQPGSLGIGEIVLTGGTAHLAGLSGELERLIGVRVRVGDPLGRMKVSKKVGEAEQVGSLAVAIGLGIED